MEKAQPRRRIGRYIKWGIGLLILVGMASCVFTLGRLFTMIGPLQEKTDAFVTQAFETGLPSPTDPVWADNMGFDEDTHQRMTRMMDSVGPPQSVEPANCSMNSYAGTEQENGTFGVCTVAVAYAKTPGDITIRWKKSGDAWLIVGFRLNYAEVDRLLDQMNNDQ